MLSIFVDCWEDLADLRSVGQDFDEAVGASITIHDDVANTLMGRMRELPTARVSARKHDVR